MSLRRTCALALCLFSATILAGCSKGSGSVETAASTPKVFRVVRSKQLTALAVLEKQHTLENALKPLGVEVRWLEFAAGPQQMEAVNAGELDLALTAESPPAFAQAADGPIVYLAQRAPSGKAVSCLVAPDANIQKVADLKGKRVTFQKASIGHYLLMKALARDGLAFSDLQPVYLLTPQFGDSRSASGLTSFAECILAAIAQQTAVHYSRHMGYPTVYPTGVTVYDPERAWSGFTIFQAAGLGALLIDMNGREVQLWEGLQGFPNKLLPGGHVFGSSAERNPAHGAQDQLDLVQVDFEGNIVWRFDRLEHISDPGETPRWYARQHHDFQREGSPVGYFAPELTPRVDGGNTLILVHENVCNPRISDKPLLDDRIVEVDWKGNIVWDWHPHEHFDELGFDDAAKASLRLDPNVRAPGASALGAPSSEGVGDWLHINSLSTLGPNRFYDAGDQRFHPDNVIWDAREANIIAIVDKRSGKIVWKLGPRFDNTNAEKKLGWIIGQHHAHLIPKGLPGAGNLLVFDNGGWAGYGTPTPGAPSGLKVAQRDYSRVLEIDPTTLEIKWQYTPKEAGFVVPLDAARFYSPFISSAQRLPNGNTLITEGSDGRIFEVTPTHEIVWEYISPYWRQGPLNLNLVYRAYRAPYEWVPQISRPKTKPIKRVDVKTFRVPGAAELGRDRSVRVRGTEAAQADGALCVTPEAGVPPLSLGG